MLIEDNTKKYFFFHTFNNIVANLNRYIDQVLASFGVITTLYLLNVGL